MGMQDNVVEALYGPRSPKMAKSHKIMTRFASSWVFPSFIYRATLRSRRAFAITDTELKVMAALAIIGLKSSPNTG
jgi:hypothetical protein